MSALDSTVRFNRKSGKRHRNRDDYTVPVSEIYKKKDKTKGKLTPITRILVKRNCRTISLHFSCLSSTLAPQTQTTAPRRRGAHARNHLPLTFGLYKRCTCEGHSHRQR
jgi:hypothetical protein